MTCRSCKQAFEVPTLRRLQQLARESSDRSSDSSAPLAAAAAARGGRPSPRKRALFAAGLALLLLFSVAGGGMLAWARKFPTDLPQSEIDAVNRASFQKIDAASMTEFWDLWHDEVLAYPPGRWVESRLVKNRHAARFRQGLAAGCFAVAGLGLVAMLTAGLLKR